MMKRHSYRFYNVVFPLWLLLWVPPVLWIVILPINYLIDWFVLKTVLRMYGQNEKLAGKHAWKTWLLGFLSDFIVAAVLYLAVLLSADTDIAIDLFKNPFQSPAALLITLFAIGISGLCIYCFNRLMLKKSTRLSTDVIHHTALWLAIVTAPYLYLIPSQLFYRG